jgi:predicted enzyme related to lactoylglutathione lyase
MGEVSSYPNGTFCWIELGTPDLGAAKTFYGGLFGWELDDERGKAVGTSTVCRLGGKDVAGIHRGAARGQWGSQICVDDVDVVTAKARERGASVLAEPADVRDAGRLSLIQDAAGAAVALWQPRRHNGAQLVNEIGTWSWNELVTPELEQAKSFYGGVFGCTVQEIPGATQGSADAPTRYSLQLGDLLVGGCHAPVPEEGDAPRWTVSFRVADADESAARAEQLGGSVLLPPMDVPVGRFAILADAAGAAFTVAAIPGGAFRGVDGS